MSSVSILVIRVGVALTLEHRGALLGGVVDSTKVAVTSLGSSLLILL